MCLGVETQTKDNMSFPKYFLLLLSILSIKHHVLEVSSVVVSILGIG